MSNQELVDAGMKTMNETDQAIERSKQVFNLRGFLKARSGLDSVLNSQVLFVGCSQDY